MGDEKERVKGGHFEFGRNWGRFLKILNRERILEAEKSLKEMLGIENLNCKNFLDIGSGSGLFSLAARKLGAKVHSFDYDSLCVACTKELKRRYFPDDKNWIIERGDILSWPYLSGLGEYDIVYSWGVLHHTGNMWKALENVVPLVRAGGRLFISIYNDQGLLSQFWKLIKKTYNHSPKLLKIIMILGVGAFLQTGAAFIRILRGQNPLPFKSWADKKKSRGMSVWHDLVDWVGGYPFEVAKPEEIFDFYRMRGFTLMKLKTCAWGLGCNEYVFIRKREGK
ncbi:MAG: class I SAM-dependent methyltransferase [Thermodesulfobacteriota bacterium]|jgi:2-polyprenyl-6-hydroxyphenyl methylase/3-demethylubiquinone-9 3-methyltransferase